MAKKKDKTLSYRRAVWLTDVSGISLESCLRDAFTELKTVAQRTIITDGKHAKNIEQKDGPSGGLLIHLVLDTPGESASVVPKAKPSSAVVHLTTQKPPPDGEWLDGDALLFVSGDDVCICSTGVGDGALQYYFYEIFKKAKLRKDSIRFDLQKVAAMSKVKLIQRQGVSAVELHGVLQNATLHYEARKAHAVGALGEIANTIATFLKKPHDRTQDSLQVSLILTVDKRRKGVTLGGKKLETIAKDVVSFDDPDSTYSILTKAGQRISEHEIFVRTSVKIDGEGKTVDPEKAWKELVQFHKTLQEDGILEQ